MGALSLDDLMKISASQRIDLEEVEIEVDGLRGKLSLDTFRLLQEGKTCVRYGMNPSNGKIICLEWSS